MNKDNNYISIVKHYEECFDKYGDSHLGVDWPKEEDVAKRYEVMVDLMKFDKSRPSLPTMLDFGCGLAHLYKYILQASETVKYSGLDISEKFIGYCKKKYPDCTFYNCDILQTPSGIPNFDYIVMNGVFTEKRELSFEEMKEYLFKMLEVVFLKCNRGVAFNVMSKLVKWERDDLFHMPMDLLTEFLNVNITRNFVIRHDYKLFEYTVYIYK